MPSLFKKTVTAYWDPKGHRCDKKEAVFFDENGKEILNPGYRRTKGKSKNWYGRYRDAEGHAHTKPLCRDKAASQQMLAKLVTDAKMGELGLADPYAEHRRHLLICPECKSTGRKANDQECQCEEGIHLSDYRRYLAAKGDTSEHVKLTIRRIHDICENCRFTRISDLAPGRVMEYLAEKRRLPGGISIGTSNHYLRAAKGFSAWLVKDRRTGQDALKYLSLLNAETDRRHRRRSLPTQEFLWLLEKTQTSQRVFRGLTGQDRYMLYTLAGYTGLRCAELASLIPPSFDLATDVPTVTIEAAYSKHRRQDVIQLREDVARLIRDYIAEKAKDAPLWPGTWSEQASAKMLRADLAEARAAWIAVAKDPAEQKRREASSFLVYRDDAGRVFDFHALRGQFISELARRGNHPKVAQELARHSHISLTMNVYTHLALTDLKAALDSLPPPPGINDSKELPPTGTEGKPGPK